MQTWKNPVFKCSVSTKGFKTRKEAGKHVPFIGTKSPETVPEETQASDLTRQNNWNMLKRTKEKHGQRVKGNKGNITWTK